MMLGRKLINQSQRSIVRWFTVNVSEQAIVKPAVVNSQIIKKRNELFNAEKQRQLSLIARIEKIQVKITGPPEDVTLVMNKNLSTPYNCAMHIQEALLTRAVLAEVNGGEMWDMHRPLEEDCTLRFRHFKEAYPLEVNKAFWRSCSFLLGLAGERAFQDSYFVELHSWPPIDIASGSFVYDMDLKLSNWKGKAEELQTLTTMLRTFIMEDYKFERLDVDASIAEKIFIDNKFKLQQIPGIAAQSATGNTVTLYRLHDHIDISRGPMISSTKQIGQFAVTAVHPVQTYCGLLYRFQGVSLPTQLRLNHFAWSTLIARSQKLNPIPLPQPVKNDKST